MFEPAVAVSCHYFIQRGIMSNLGAAFPSIVYGSTDLSTSVQSAYKYSHGAHC